MRNPNPETTAPHQRGLINEMCSLIAQYQYRDPIMRQVIASELPEEMISVPDGTRALASKERRYAGS